MVGFALLVGCGPHVEEEDDFVERRCQIWCDGLEPCEHDELTRTECFEGCVESERWTESCRDDRAAYHDCLLSLSCDELAERTEKGIAGEDVSGFACWDEAVESAVCS